VERASDAYRSRLPRRVPIILIAEPDVWTGALLEIDVSRETTLPMDGWVWEQWDLIDLFHVEQSKPVDPWRLVSRGTETWLHGDMSLSVLCFR
jgi:hypothetical protein